MSIALITGASKGFGRALATALAERGWTLIIDARGRDALLETARDLAPARVVAVTGDVTHPTHRRALIGAAEAQGGLDLLVNNAGYLGPSPQPPLVAYPSAELARVYEIGVFAPLALTQEAFPLLSASSGAIVNITSDAAVEPYEGWGGYGSAKAALDQVTAVLAREHPELPIYAFDPGDMRTEMHQRAYPGEDISDRPEPSTVVPALLRLLEDRPPSGRYRASDLLARLSG